MKRFTSHLIFALALLGAGFVGCEQEITGPEAKINETDMQRAATVGGDPKMPGGPKGPMAPTGIASPMR